MRGYYFEIGADTTRAKASLQSLQGEVSKLIREKNNVNITVDEAAVARKVRGAMERVKNQAEREQINIRSLIKLEDAGISVEKAAAAGFGPAKAQMRAASIADKADRKTQMTFAAAQSKTTDGLELLTGSLVKMSISVIALKKAMDILGEIKFSEASNAALQARLGGVQGRLGTAGLTTEAQAIQVQRNVSAFEAWANQQEAKLSWLPKVVTGGVLGKLGDFRQLYKENAEASLSSLAAQPGLRRRISRFTPSGNMADPLDILQQEQFEELRPLRAASERFKNNPDVAFALTRTQQAQQAEMKLASMQRRAEFQMQAVAIRQQALQGMQIKDLYEGNTKRALFHEFEARQMSFGEEALKSALLNAPVSEHPLIREQFKQGMKNLRAEAAYRLRDLRETPTEALLFRGGEAGGGPMIDKTRRGVGDDMKAIFGDKWNDFGTRQDQTNEILRAILDAQLQGQVLN